MTELESYLDLEDIGPQVDSDLNQLDGLAAYLNLELPTAKPIEPPTAEPQVDGRIIIIRTTTRPGSSQQTMSKSTSVVPTYSEHSSDFSSSSSSSSGKSKGSSSSSSSDSESGSFSSSSPGSKGSSSSSSNSSDSSSSSEEEDNDFELQVSRTTLPRKDASESTASFESAPSSRSQSPVMPSHSVPATPQAHKWEMGVESSLEPGSLKVKPFSSRKSLSTKDSLTEILEKSYSQSSASSSLEVASKPSNNVLDDLLAAVQSPTPVQAIYWRTDFIASPSPLDDLLKENTRSGSSKSSRTTFRKPKSTKPTSSTSFVSHNVEATAESESTRIAAELRTTGKTNLYFPLLGSNLTLSGFAAHQN